MGFAAVQIREGGARAGRTDENCFIQVTTNQTAAAVRNMPRAAKETFAGEQRSVRGLEHEKSGKAVNRELAIQEPDAEDQATPVRAISCQPQQDDI